MESGKEEWKAWKTRGNEGYEHLRGRAAEKKGKSGEIRSKEEKGSKVRVEEKK